MEGKEGGRGGREGGEEREHKVIISKSSSHSEVLDTQVGPTMANHFNWRYGCTINRTMSCLPQTVPILFQETP